jgi:putative membrane protein
VSLAAWTWDPGVLLTLGAIAVWYGLGWRHWVRRSRARPARWRAAAFYSGVVLIVLALLSPIGTYDVQSFALHMLQHMLLVVGAAPLLLLGAPLLALLWGLPEQERRGLGRLLRRETPLHGLGTTLTHPLVSGTLFLTVFGVWHIPALYDAAQGRTLIHDLEHALFLATAILFWWPVIHPGGGARRLSSLGAMAYLVPPMLEGTVVGALLTFAPQPLYTTYRASSGFAGLSTIEDQQLAGLIMWLPSGLIYLGAILTLLGLALREPHQAEHIASGRSR